MRLFEAILEANQRAVAGDKTAGLHPTEFDSELPIVALTCIDARLNKLLPAALGVPEEKFIWLRNAGNIITGPMSSTMRSLSLACAVKGGREIVVIGHTDCLVCKSTVMKLTDAFSAMGVNRSRLPENLTEFFGMFASERQNVIKAADFIRSSPIIGTKIPVHGLIIDIESGRLEWVVNGYQTPVVTGSEVHAKIQIGDKTLEGSLSLPNFNLGEMKFPEFKIGEVAVNVDAGRAHPKETSRMATPRDETQIGQTQRAETPVSATPIAETPATPEHESRMKMFLDAAKKFRIIGSDQKEYGPISGAKIMEWIVEKRIDWRTPAKMEGTSGWQPLLAFAEKMLRHPPPLPPSSKSKMPLPKIDRR